MRNSAWIVAALVLTLAALPHPSAAKGGGGGGKPGGSGGDPPAPPAPEIAYFEDGNLYVMDADGGNPTLVLADAANPNLGECTWSPERTRIAFRGDVQGDGLYVVGVDGAGLTRIYEGSISYPAWSPSTSASVPVKIAFRAGTSLRVTNPDGSQNQALPSQAFSVESYPAWSPDGTRLAVRFNDVQGTSTVTAAGLAVYTLAYDTDGWVASTSQQVIVVDTARPLDVGFAWLDWSPDGTYLAYADYDETELQYDLWMIDPDAADPQPIRLTGTGSVDERFPRWSPDGTMLVFDRQATSRKERGLYVLDLLTGGIASLGTTSGRFPDWAP